MLPMIMRGSRLGEGQKLRLHKSAGAGEIDPLYVPAPIKGSDSASDGHG